jgi:transcriptional regulator with XRE-family HTH domain
MTKAELARRSGVSPQTIQKVEDGSTKDVTPENREKLAPVLGEPRSARGTDRITHHL